MSFQETANTLRSRLHLDRFSPSFLVIGFVVCTLLLVCGAYAFVELVASHSFEVSRAQATENEAVEGADTEELAETPDTSEVVVHVSGRVVSPGVYSLPEGSRVSDAIEASGGFADDARQDAVNLARVVVDAEQIHIPSTEEVSGGGLSGGVTTSSQMSSSGSLININTASVEELTKLDGVGASTAKKIVQERVQNGSFKSIEDIKRVSGIGEKRFEAIKDFICV